MPRGLVACLVHEAVLERTSTQFLQVERVRGERGFRRRAAGQATAPRRRRALLAALLEPPLSARELRLHPRQQTQSAQYMQELWSMRARSGYVWRPHVAAVDPRRISPAAL